MFEFFKKQQNQPVVLTAEEKEAAAQDQVKIDDKIAIHVMPEYFRHRTVKVHGAKKTGIFIMVGGVMILLIVSAVLYYFLFIQPKKAVAPVRQTETTNAQPAQPAEQPVNVSTSTESATLPTESIVATSTIATSTPETVGGTETINYSPGLDSDQDGLTDKEEALLGTSPLTPDSDSDGYFDGAEFRNLYDPAGKGKLVDNQAISLYQNKTFNYSLLYPQAWQTSTNGGDDSVMFKTDDNQFIQAITQPNVNKQTLDAWFIDQLGVSSINESDRVDETTWQGIKSPDGLTLYLMDSRQNYIFTLSYNLGGGSILDYTDIFETMIKSFILHD